MVLTDEERKLARNALLHQCSNAANKRLTDADYEELQNYGWRELLGDIREGDSASKLTWQEFRDTDFVIGMLRHDQVDTLSFRFKMQCGWNREAVRFRIHTIPLANPATTETIVWKGSLVWARCQTEVPSVSSWDSFTVLQTVEPGGHNIDIRLDICESTPPSGCDESAILCVHLERDTGDARDTYVTNKPYGLGQANVAMLATYVHYRCCGHGTEE